MRFIKLFENFRINEEWIPSGPYTRLIDSSNKTICQFRETKTSGVFGIEFIGRDGNYFEEVKENIEKLLELSENGDYLDVSFDINSSMSNVEDIEVLYLTVFENSLGDDYQIMHNYLGDMGDFVSEDIQGIISIELNDVLKIRVR